MDLDLVPRINGVAVDVDNTSVVELYKIVSINIPVSTKNIHTWSKIVRRYTEHYLPGLCNTGCHVTRHIQFYTIMGVHSALPLVESHDLQY